MMRKKKTRNILYIIFKYFEADPRPQREVAALLDNGYHVDVICLHPIYADRKIIYNKKINYYTIKLNKQRGSKISYIFQYSTFFFFTLFQGLRLFLHNRYDLIQIFVMPELLVLSCIFQKFLGTKILMDLEDPSLEVYQTIYKDKKKFLLNIIQFIEKLAVKASDKIITPNEGFRQAFILRGYKPDKIDIVMNLPDKRIFNKKYDEIYLSHQKTHYILYNGSIIHRHGLDICIEALNEVVKEKPDVCLYIFGSKDTTDYYLRCKLLSKKLNVDKNIKWCKPVGIYRMPKFIKNASMIVIPNRDTPFTRINLPTRIMEGGILKTPVIVSRLPGIKHYFNSTEVYFFEPDNPKDMAEKIINLLNSKEKVKKLVERNFTKCKSLEWEKSYLDIVDSLINKE